MLGVRELPRRAGDDCLRDRFQPSSSCDWVPRAGLYMDVGVPSPLLSHPTLPAIPNLGWGHEKLTSPRLAFVWRRFESLRDLGVTVPKVVKEFLQCRIAPLQRHSHRMWTFVGHGDRMRLQEEDLAPEALRTVLRVLTGAPSAGSIRHGAALLYLCSGRADFVRPMPSFDEWGLRPVGLMGPRENPVVVVVLPIAHSGPASGNGAGRREPSGAEGSDVEILTPRGAPKASSSGVHPGVVEDEESRLETPEARTPEARTDLQGAAPCGASQSGALGASHPDVPSMPRDGPRVRGLGRFLIDFEALRKRKEASRAMTAPAAH